MAADTPASSTSARNDALSSKGRLPNHHATALFIDGQGFLIEGASGSGKTSLALGLLTHCRLAGVECRLVSDDQVLLEAADGRLIAHAPPEIAGSMELPHHGVISVNYLAKCNIGRIFRLEPDAPRLAEPGITHLCSVALPVHILPARHEAAAMRIVLHLLGISAV